MRACFLPRWLNVETIHALMINNVSFYPKGSTFYHVPERHAIPVSDDDVGYCTLYSPVYGKGDRSDAYCCLPRHCCSRVSIL